MKERRQAFTQAPRIAALPQLVHDGPRDGVLVLGHVFTERRREVSRQT
jgi:hypothetical protein